MGLQHLLIVAFTAGLAARPWLAAELAPWWSAAADAALLVCAVGLVVVRGSRGWLVFRLVRWPWLCWIAAVCLQLVWHPGQTLSPGETAALIGGPLLLGAAAAMRESQRRRLLLAVCLTGGTIGGYALWQAWALLPQLADATATAAAGSADAMLYEVASRGRALGTFALPTLLAGYLSLLIPLSIDLLTRQRTKSLAVRALTCNALILISLGWLLARSLGAWMSLAAACVVVWCKRRLTRRQLAAGLVTGFLCGVVIFAGRPALWHDRAHHPLWNRLAYWHAALRAMKAHPLQGLGPGGFAAAASRSAEAPAQWARHAHNTYLHLGAELGVPALIAWSWLVAAILKRASTAAPWLAVAVWTLPLHNLVDFSFSVPQVALLWWYLAGWALSAGLKTSRGRAGPSGESRRKSRSLRRLFITCL